MKRYYICPVVEYRDGDTTGRESYIENRYPGQYSCAVQISDDRAIPWAVVLVSGPNHSQLLNDPSIDDLPDFPLDGKVSAIHKPTRDKMIAKLQARGIDTAFISTADGFREVVRTLGQRLNPNFSENSFDVMG